MWLCVAILGPGVGQDFGPSPPPVLPSVEVKWGGWWMDSAGPHLDGTVFGASYGFISGKLFGDRFTLAFRVAYFQDIYYNVASSGDGRMEGMSIRLGVVF